MNLVFRDGATSQLHTLAIGQYGPGGGWSQGWPAAGYEWTGTVMHPTYQTGQTADQNNWSDNGGGSRPMHGVDEIVGIQVWSHDWATANLSSAEYDARLLPGQTGPTNGATTGYTSPLGITSPDDCMWWFGERIGGSDPKYDPAGDLDGGGPTGGGGSDEPPPDPRDGGGAPQEEGCSFSVTDPSSWAGGGICLLVQLVRNMLGALGDILDAILSLPASLAGAIAAAMGAVIDAVAGIAGAIIDGVSALFVPDSDHWHTKIDNVHDAWADAGPAPIIGAVGDAVGAVDVSASSSCSGPTMHIDVPNGGPVNAHPLDTCGDTMSLIAAIVKAALTVMLWLSGLWISAQVLAASFGLALPSLGKGDA